MRYKVVHFEFTTGSTEVEFGKITCDAAQTRISSLTPFYPLLDICANNNIVVNDKPYFEVLLSNGIQTQAPYYNFELKREFQISTPLQAGPDGNLHILALVAA